MDHGRDSITDKRVTDSACVDRWMDYIHIQYEYEYQYETPRRGILCVFIRTYVRTDSLLES